MAVIPLLLKQGTIQILLEKHGGQWGGLVLGIGLRQHSNFTQNLLGWMQLPELHDALGMSGDLECGSSILHIIEKT